MYVRVKKIGSKRYLYLVRGILKSGRVKQKSLAYLGPVSKIAMGVPAEVMEKVDRRLSGVEWSKVNMAIRDIPLTFEELQEMKRDLFPKVLAMRQSRSGDSGRGSRPRIEGELAALTLIAKKEFDEMFETLKDGTLVMR